MPSPAHVWFGAAAALLSLTLTACSDSGASARSGSASGSGSGSVAEAGAHQAPEGVVHEYATMADEIAAEGGETTSGPWRVGYIVEGAEPWHETRDGKQVFRPVAAGETHHIEILPFEAATGRLVPATEITVEILDEAGKVVDAQPLRFLYGEFFHYAANFSVPAPGEYTLRATIATPTFARHGEQGETPPLTDGTTVTFEGVQLD